METIFERREREAEKKEAMDRWVNVSLEKITNAFQRELDLRPKADEQQRKLLFFKVFNYHIGLPGFNEKDRRKFIEQLLAELGNKHPELIPLFPTLPPSSPSKNSPLPDDDSADYWWRKED